MGSETVGEAQGRKLGRDRRLGVGHEGDAHLEEPGAVELREARLPGVVVVEEGRLDGAERGGVGRRSACMNAANLENTSSESDIRGKVGGGK